LNIYDEIETAGKTEERAAIEVCPVYDSEMKKGFYIVSHQTN
jgi:hypothetical protein